MWGILCSVGMVCASTRFIPTRVGNTALKLSKLRVDSVHPHACGEYSRVGHLYAGGVGSSPRVWGILPRYQVKEVKLQVHPHACGEYCMRESITLAGTGSSPRVWGIHKSALPYMTPFRFIPTRVGNTPFSIHGWASATRFIPTRVGNTSVSFAPP